MLKVKLINDSKATAFVLFPFATPVFVYLVQKNCVA